MAPPLYRSYCVMRNFSSKSYCLFVQICTIFICTISSTQSIPGQCLQEHDPGPCNNFNLFGLQYYWNSNVQKCNMFYYGGCGGNGNRFQTYQQCINTCQKDTTSPVDQTLGCRGCNLERATCETGSSGNYCKCKKGYTKDSSGNCMDIDECRTRTLCQRYAWCTNTIGSYQCKCKAGYVGDGRDSCTFVGLGRATDDCRRCHTDAVCLRGVCQCKLGYQGDGYTCKEIDECELDVYPCDVLAQCTNTPGSFMCTCNDGYSGDGYKCYDFHVACKTPFRREQYEKSCLGEKWVDRYYFDVTTKRCAQFWYGGCKGSSPNIFSDIATCQKCETLKIGCGKCDTKTSYCLFHGAVNYTCECREGFVKDRRGDCTDRDECKDYSADCHPKAQCTNTFGSYSCACLAGYKGSGKQCTYVGTGQRVNMCAMCHPASTCRNNVCQCKLGYQGDGLVCQDVNECESKPYPCSKSATCINTEGSFFCRCQPGLAGNGFTCFNATSEVCTDKWDPRYEATCAVDSNHQSRYTYDYLKKRCTQFWYGGCNSTSRNIFTEISTCRNFCEARKIDPCQFKKDPGPCQYWQSKWYFDPVSKRCAQFYYGGCLGNKNRFDDKFKCIKTCKYREEQTNTIPEVCFLPSDKGYCKDGRRHLTEMWYFDADSGTCQRFQYAGCGGNHNKFYSIYHCKKVCGERLSPKSVCDKCDISRSYCKENSKYNFTCECKDGFRKNDYNECIDIDECTVNPPCHARAFCKNIEGSYTCECSAGYSGDGKLNCHYVGLGRATDNCKRCHSGADCKKNVCTCRVGFKGDGFTCDDVDECQSFTNPCSKEAFCSNTYGSFMCTCRDGWAGNGYACTQSPKACLEAIDHGYKAKCAGSNWEERFMFDASTRKCTLMWYDGCPGDSLNIFSQLATCQEMCEKSRVMQRSTVCWDDYDENYEKQCRQPYQMRYYFDHKLLSCKMFWYGGCKISTQNVFPDLHSCQWLCSADRVYRARACLEPFDVGYTNDCTGGGNWKQKYFFDSNDKTCKHFWYGGCQSSNENLFDDRRTCEYTCELPAKLATEQNIEFPDVGSSLNIPSSKNMRKSEPIFKDKNTKTNSKPWHKKTELKPQKIKANNTKLKGKEKTMDNKSKKMSLSKTKYDSKNTEIMVNGQNTEANANGSNTTEDNACNPNPCKNDGDCMLDVSAKTGYICNCTVGISGKTCTVMPDKLCDSYPCLNGGTCKESNGGSTHWCKCVKGYMGDNCDLSLSGTLPPTSKGFIPTMKTRRPEPTTTTTTEPPSTTTINITVTPVPLSSRASDIKPMKFILCTLFLFLFFNVADSHIYGFL